LREHASEPRDYEMMVVVTPTVAEEGLPPVIERVSGYITNQGGTVSSTINENPWGRRRLAYQIDRFREGSYHIVLFEAPGEALNDLERTLQITEEVLRHLVTRDERPARPGRRDGTAEGGEETDDDAELPSAEDEDDGDDSTERIDESESEAAPAAID
jgi:small subunit ribosomal protein S6